MPIRVKVVQLGRGVLACEVDRDSTVADVLSAQNVPVDGAEVRVNSASTALDQRLEDGDLVTVVPLIKGGSIAPDPRFAGTGTHGSSDERS